MHCLFGLSVAVNRKLLYFGSWYIILLLLRKLTKLTKDAVEMLEACLGGQMNVHAMEGERKKCFSQLSALEECLGSNSV